MANVEGMAYGVAFRVVRTRALHPLEVTDSEDVQMTCFVPALNVMGVRVVLLLFLLTGVGWCSPLRGTGATL